MKKQMIVTLIQDIDEAANKLTEVIIKVVNKHAAEVNIKLRKNHNHAITENMREMIRKRNKMSIEAFKD